MFLLLKFLLMLSRLLRLLWEIWWCGCSILLWIFLCFLRVWGEVFVEVCGGGGGYGLLHSNEFMNTLFNI